MLSDEHCETASFAGTFRRGLAPLRMFEAILESTFGPRVGHEMLPSMTTLRLVSWLHPYASPSRTERWLLSGLDLVRYLEENATFANDSLIGPVLSGTYPVTFLRNATANLKCTYGTIGRSSMTSRLARS
jgi:hypothetical protein